MELTKRQAVWICRRVIKLYHPDYRGNTELKKEYWEKFLDILLDSGKITEEDRNSWSCPFK